MAIDADLYLELALHLRSAGDPRAPHEAVDEAVRHWLLAARSAARAHSEPTGYQWKEVFLPEHTMLRVRQGQRNVCAEVIGNRLLYQGRPTTPGALAQLSGLNVRNAWRQLWIRWPGETQWLAAIYVRTFARAGRRVRSGALPTGREPWPAQSSLQSASAPPESPESS